MSTIFPWLMNSWQKLTSYKKNNRIPSAILMTAAEGSGELVFASEFAKFILCQQSNDNACDECRSCTLFKAENHPDYFFISGEEKTATIKIDQIRALIDTLDQTSILGDYQVVLISLAENMNKAAANALLKTLEEPRGRVLIILLSHQSNRVAATVRSRCQHIKLPLPTKLLDEFINTDQKQLREKIIVQLQQIKNNEIDPSVVSAECATVAREVMQFLITLILDMIKIKFSAKEYLTHPDKKNVLTELCLDLSSIYLFKFLDIILEAKRLLLDNNINIQLLMEKIFINWRYHHDVN